MKAAAKQVADKAPVFDKEDLIAAASSFGSTPEIMTGALYAVTEPITREEAAEALDAFLTRPVEN